MADALLMPHQMKCLAHHATLGLGWLGAIGNHSSGDRFLGFSTPNKTVLTAKDAQAEGTELIQDAHLSSLFEAVIQGVEKTIINSMIANKTMIGGDGNTVPALVSSAQSQLARAIEPKQAAE